MLSDVAFSVYEWSKCAFAQHALLSVEGLINKMTKNYPLNPRFTLPFAFLLAVSLLAVSLLFMLPVGSVHAQQPEQFFTYAENGTSPVATFTATDPEGVTPIHWSLLPAETNVEAIEGLENGDDIDFASFKIDQSGVLSFKSSPNYEAPAGGDDNNATNTYRAVVRASDGTENDYYKVIVTVTNVDEPGKVTLNVDPDGAGSIIFSPAMGLLQFRAGAIVTAVVTDPEGATSISYKWYRSSSRSATGTEISGTPTDGTYSVSDSPSNNDVASYIRVAATYRENATSSPKTVSFVSENPVLGARANNPPMFASGTVNRRIAENATAGDPVGGPITASDSDGDILTYSLSGDAADSFALNTATGQLTVKAGADLNRDGAAADTRSVMVTVNDPSGSSTPITTTVTITISDVNEAPEFADDSLRVATIVENADTLTIGNYIATDPELDGITLSLMGTDAGSFELTGADNNTLAFKASPDFDMPGDENRDNVYEVTVRASDGGNNTDLKVAVKVTDVDEDGSVTLSSQDAQIGVALTATLKDDDGGVPNAAQFTDQKWTWHRLPTGQSAADVDDDNAIAGATSSTYTPTSADSGMLLAAMVSYTDRHGMKTETSTTVTRAVRAAATNQAPKFTDGASTFRIVAENAAADDADATADDVGSVIFATDGNEDALAYTLSGADAAFFEVLFASNDETTTDVNEAGHAQIQVKSGTKLDYETRSSYTVTLTANDGSGGSTATATITVNIYVTDMDEAPTIMVGDVSADLSISGQASPVYAENGTAPVATYMLAGTNAASATWSLEGDDAGDFTISGGMLRFVSSPDFEMPADANGDNVYMVTVKASEGTDMDTLEVTVTVTDEDDAVVVLDLLDRYDNDDSGHIDLGEAVQAVRDYQSGDITLAEAVQVIRLYQAGPQ